MNEISKAIYFDMDGTIADLYSVKSWLTMLEQRNVYPYANAKVLVNALEFSGLIHKLQKKGYTVGIVSWLCKNSNKKYDREVAQAKMAWLKEAFPLIKFNEISLVPYGTPKSTCVKYVKGILFDDEENNRKEWKGTSYTEKNIIKILKNLAEIA